ncbi:MAG: FHA domain-containing protein [Actinobacteria bacterium]|nr:FHA domain-containing protein [Actinomycetota bacterium]
MTPDENPRPDPSPAGLSPLSGDGVLIRQGALAIVLVGPDAIGCVDEVRSLIEGRDASGAIRVLARDLLRRDLTSAAVVGPADVGDEVFAFGPIDIITKSERISAAREIVSLSRRLEPGELVAIVPEESQAPSSWQSLEQGVVAAVGFSLRSDAVVAATDGSDKFESINLSADGSLVGNAPLLIEGSANLGGHDGPDVSQLQQYEVPVEVLGVMSPKGFFNHPEARYCSRSGVKIGASHTRSFVKGVRPALGVITFDDGLTFTVQWNTVIGRDPTADERVGDASAAPLMLDGEEVTVSRRHLFIELREWDVLVTDLDTANGTRIRMSADDQPRALAGGEKVVIAHGSEVFLGDRSFIYHEHHTR